jgi:hypothetical protein
MGFLQPALYHPARRRARKRKRPAANFRVLATLPLWVNPPWYADSPAEELPRLLYRRPSGVRLRRDIE